MARLVLCAYDVMHPRRLAAARDAVTAWSHGGQRSAFECLAVRQDERALARAVAASLCARQDRLALFHPARRGSFTLGTGRLAEDGPIVYIG